MQEGLDRFGDERRVEVDSNTIESQSSRAKSHQQRGPEACDEQKREDLVGNP